MNLKNKVLILFTFLLLVLTACTKNDEFKNETKNSEINFIDDDGIEISLENPTKKIISMYSAHTENIYYLGAEDTLIGGYKTCIYPPAAAFLNKYDYNGDPEEVIAAEPDILIIRPFIRQKAPNYIRAVENAGITVVSLYPSGFDEFDDYINKLALLTGSTEKAEILLEDFHNEINNIKEMTSKQDNKKTVFFESTEVNLRTVTPNSMAGLAIEFAGGINLAKDVKPIEKGSTIAPFGEEKILENADKIDVYISQRGSMNSGGNLVSILSRTGFDNIKAVKDGKVFTVNEKIISSPTFRYIKGVKEIARFLYPDLIDNIDDYKNDDFASRRDFADIVVKHNHIPIFLPSSSSYYSTEQRGHTFGLFEDISWLDNDFNYIETAVEKGYVLWDKGDDEKEYFNPDKKISRDELAQCIFVMGDFKNSDINTPISDLEKSNHQKIVQILVDNHVFELNNGNFEPERYVTKNEIINALSYVK